MGRAEVAKNYEKCKVFGHPRGGQGGQGSPWGPWAALGWQKMRKNTGFLATPGAAKVDQGPLGANAHAGVAKNVGKHRVFGHPRSGQGGSRAPWGQWPTLGWPKKSENMRFLATPGAA